MHVCVYFFRSMREFWIVILASFDTKCSGILSKCISFAADKASGTSKSLISNHKRWTVIVEQLQILRNPWDISREHTWNLKSCKGVWGDEDVLGHCKSLVEIQVLVCTEKERHL